MAQSAFRFSAEALVDLDQIFDFMVDVSGFSRTARSFSERIISRCELLIEYPEAGRARPDLGNNLRELPFDRVMILYRYDNETVDIARIFYGGQDYETVMRSSPP